MSIIATAPIPRQFRLVDADTFPLPHPVQSARPACPVWCDQTCAATEGGVFHSNTIASITDTIDGEPSIIAVEVERFDLDGRPGRASLNVQLIKGTGGLGPAATAALIDALTHANAVVIADRASHAGGR